VKKYWKAEELHQANKLYYPKLSFEKTNIVLASIEQF